MRYLYQTFVFHFHEQSWLIRKLLFLKILPRFYSKLDINSSFKMSQFLSFTEY